MVVLTDDNTTGGPYDTTGGPYDSLGSSTVSSPPATPYSSHSATAPAFLPYSIAPPPAGTASASARLLPAGISSHLPSDTPTPPPPGPGRTSALEPLPPSCGIFSYARVPALGDVAIEVSNASFRWPEKKLQPGDGGAPTGINTGGGSVTVTNTGGGASAPSGTNTGGGIATRTNTGGGASAPTGTNTGGGSANGTNTGARASAPNGGGGIAYGTNTGGGAAATDAAATPGLNPEALPPTVSGLEFRIRQGWLVGLSGCSGSGKSTLLQVIYGYMAVSFYLSIYLCIYIHIYI